MSKFDLKSLQSAVTGSSVAYRARTRMQPVGGVGDKIFPPTYATGDKAKTKYALETRRVNGQDTLCVLLDSVASQANRLEMALLKAWERGQLSLPMILVDFSDEKEIDDLDTISVLQAPHRIADALLRDSVDPKDGGKLFRETAAGQAMTDARVNHAAPLYKYCPQALVFGVWDSTGPRGGLGSKFPRCLVSEIIGVNIQSGSKTASRIDPAQIGSKVQIFEAKVKEEQWTSLAADAKQVKGQPVLYSKEKGKPSAVNHGNIAPTIDEKAGGVTMDYAERIAVLSLSAIRQLAFPKDLAGNAVPGEKRSAVENAARTVLAALGLAALALAWEDDHFLRSRCHLVPEGALVFESVDRLGAVAQSFELSAAEALKLFAEAVAAAEKLGLVWNKEKIVLKPAPKLAHLIRETRKLAAEEGETESE